MPKPTIGNRDEVFYEAVNNPLVGNTAVHYIYPPTDLYNHNGEVLEPYVSTPNDRIINVDIAFLKLKHFRDSTQDLSYNDGLFEKTNVSGAFFAVEPNDYYYLYNVSESTLTAPDLERGTNIPLIAESIKLPNNSTGATFENKSLEMETANVNRFDDIEVEGLNEGVKPNTMQATAIRLEKQNIEDVTYRCFDTDTITPTHRSSTTSRENITAAKSIADQAQSHFTGIDKDFLDENSSEFVNENTGVPFVDSSSQVSAVEIINVERDLDDFRYGDQEDDFPFIFTGASHYFTGSQVGDNTPVDFNVWGGDCFIGLHTFKVSDTAYSLTDGEKDIDNTGAIGSQSSQASKWGYYFRKDLAQSVDVSRPFPLKGTSQTITVLLESEINPQVEEKSPHNEFNYNSASAIDATNLPFPIADESGQIRSSFKYRFNLDYARANEYKVFFPYKTYEKNNNEFGARIPYSDQKIYNTDIEGFDRFRAFNFYDLDESHGSGTKLIEAGDRIFALQESALTYIPVQARSIQTAEGGNLAVRDAEIIGIPNKIDVLYGCQNPKTVKIDGNSFFYADTRRGEIMMFDGKSPKSISQNGMESWFNTEFAAHQTRILASTGSVSDLNAIYDNKSKEYMVFFRNQLHRSAVFNAEYGVWGATFPEEATVANTLGGVMVGGTFMLAGIEEDSNPNVVIGSLYTSSGTLNTWWGTKYTPKLKFLINPNPDWVKTYDAFTFISTRVIDPQSLVVIQSDGTSSTADLSGIVVNDTEGTFRIKSVRDADGKRSRGTYAEMEIDFKYPDWVTGRIYKVGDFVTESNLGYKCLVYHTAGTHATDLGLNYWVSSAEVQSGITSAITRYRPSHKPY